MRVTLLLIAAGYLDGWGPDAPPTAGIAGSGDASERAGVPQLHHSLAQRGLERAAAWTGHDYVRGVFSILEGLKGALPNLA